VRGVLDVFDEDFGDILKTPNEVMYPEICVCLEEHNPSTRFHSIWKEPSNLRSLQANLVQR